MKNRIFYWICVFNFFILNAQMNIEGTVYFDNKPLESAAVYFNNSMLGTTTNSNGAFYLQAKEGQFDLIISYLGLKTITYTLNTSNYKKPLVFTLVEDEKLLDEIIIKKTVYDEEWKYNLSRFKKEFIGRTELAENCNIENTKVIYFEHDAKENKLKAYARKPLIIKNKELGYKITYDLVDFTINKNFVSFLGYSRYENLKGSKKKVKKWNANRLKAYKGSYTHFYQSILNNSTYKDGFIIHQFKRVRNEERPTEVAIKKARDLIQLSKNTIDFSKPIHNPKNAIDSALIVLKKVKLPKFKDLLYRSKVPVSELITRKEEKVFLTFENNLSIVYTKELESSQFLNQGFARQNRKPSWQTSSIINLNKTPYIDRTGNLINPLDVYYEGYWAFEKLANALPLDYKPSF